MCSFMLDDAGPAGDWTRHVQTDGNERRDQKSKASVQIQPGLPREGLVAYFKSRKDREGSFGMTRRGSTVSMTHLREEDFQVLRHASTVRQGRRKEGWGVIRTFLVSFHLKHSARPLGTVPRTPTKAT